jgi:polysaccharide export outer membrane protein
MLVRLLRIAVTCFVLALVASCASEPALRADAPAVVATNQLPAPDQTDAQTSYQNAVDYRIGAQDLLEISVFGLPEIQREVRVNAGGHISLPLAGDFAAGGMTTKELEGAIAARLSENYLQNPQVSVFIKEYTSQRITLEGAVTKPGIYPLTGKTTLLQAIATAQGLDPLADPRAVVIFRVIDGRKMGAVFDIKKIRRGQVVDPQVYGDDIVVVDQSASKTALRRFVEAVPALALFTVF